MRPTEGENCCCIRDCGHSSWWGNGWWPTQCNIWEHSPSVVSLSLLLWSRRLDRIPLTPIWGSGHDQLPLNGHARLWDSVLWSCLGDFFLRFACPLPTFTLLSRFSKVDRISSSSTRVEIRMRPKFSCFSSNLLHLSVSGIFLAMTVEVISFTLLCSLETRKLWIADGSTGIPCGSSPVSSWSLSLFLWKVEGWSMGNGIPSGRGFCFLCAVWFSCCSFNAAGILWSCRNSFTDWPPFVIEYEKKGQFAQIKKNCVISMRRKCRV